MLGSTATGTIRVNNNWWEKTTAAAIAATIEDNAPIIVNTSGFLTTAPVRIDAMLGNNPLQLQNLSIEYYHTDGFNSPNLATNASGAVLWQEHYQPFGESRLNQDPNPTINYTGHALDRDSGLIYAGARYLDPAIGRFMSMDPVEFTETNPVSFNRFAYANNSPYMFADPNGESPIDIAFLAVDTYRLASAIYNGENVGGAAFDFAASAAGVISPVPGVGQGIKIAKAADKVADASKAVDAATSAVKLSKVEKSKTVEKIGDKFTKTTKTFPGRGPGQSRSEMEFVKNQDGKLIRSRKFSYDRSGKFQHSKPARGGPEGRGANEN